MRPKHRQFLSYFLMATYASISLLGDGLHLLLPEGGQHHHHHGIHIAGHSCHDSQQDDHHHGDTCCSDCAHDVGPAISDAGADGHLCEICSFIVHAVAQPVEEVATIDWRPLIVQSQPETQAIYSCVSLGPQAPRGPPSLVG